MEKENLINKIQNLLNKTTENGATEQEAQSAILMAQKLMAKHGLDIADVKTSSNDKETQKEIIQDYGTKGHKLAWWHKSLAKVIADNFRCYYFMRGFYKETRIVFMGVKEDVEIAKSIFEFASEQIEYHARQYRKSRKRELEKELLPEDFKKWSIEEVVDYAINEVRVSAGIVHRIRFNYSEESMQRKYITQEIKKRVGADIDGPALRNDYIKGFLKGLNDKFKEQVEANKAEWGLILVKDKDLVEKYEDLSKNFKTARASEVSTSHDGKAYAAGVEQGRQFNQVSGRLK